MSGLYGFNGRDVAKNLLIHIDPELKALFCAYKHPESLDTCFYCKYDFKFACDHPVFSNEGGRNYPDFTRDKPEWCPGKEEED